MRNRHEQSWERLLLRYGYYPGQFDEWFAYTVENGEVVWAQVSRDWPLAAHEQRNGEYLDWYATLGYPGDQDYSQSELLADRTTQARQCVKVAIVADTENLSSPEAIHRLAVIAIKALQRIDLDGDNGIGGTWRESLAMVVEIAADTCGA